MNVRWLLFMLNLTAFADEMQTMPVIVLKYRSSLAHHCLRAFFNSFVHCQRHLAVVSLCQQLSAKSKIKQNPILRKKKKKKKTECESSASLKRNNSADVGLIVVVIKRNFEAAGNSRIPPPDCCNYVCQTEIEQTAGKWARLYQHMHAGSFSRIFYGEREWRDSTDGSAC